jgi:hypothetical protein
VTVSEIWRAFAREFDELAQREGELSKEIPRGRQALRAVCSYGDKLPEFGQITICGDEIPRVRAEFELSGTRAGITLGCPSAVRPVEFWIHSLCQDLLKTESSELSFGSGEGGVIEGLVASSAAYCLRLATAAAEEEHRAAGGPRLPELSDSSKRKLAIQWDSLVDRHRLATADIDRYVAASGQTRTLAVSKPPTTSGRWTESWLLQHDSAKRECGITPSVDAAKARFAALAKEYWTIWESSVAGYETYRDQLKAVKDQVLFELSAAWRACSEAAYQWYEAAVVSAADQALNASARTLVEQARNAELLRLARPADDGTKKGFVDLIASEAESAYRLGMEAIGRFEQSQREATAPLRELIEISRKRRDALPDPLSLHAPKPALSYAEALEEFAKAHPNLGALDNESAGDPVGTDRGAIPTAEPERTPVITFEGSGMVLISRDLDMPTELQWYARAGGDFIRELLFQPYDRVRTNDEVRCERFDEPRIITRVDCDIRRNGIWKAAILPKSHWERRFGRPADPERPKAPVEPHQTTAAKQTDHATGAAIETRGAFEFESSQGCTDALAAYLKCWTTKDWVCSEASLARTAKVDPADLSKWKKGQLPADSDKKARIERAIRNNDPATPPPRIPEP